MYLPEVFRDTYLLYTLPYPKSETCLGVPTPLYPSNLPKNPNHLPPLYTPGVYPKPALNLAAYNITFDMSTTH